MMLRMESSLEESTSPCRNPFYRRFNRYTVQDDGLKWLPVPWTDDEYDMANKAAKLVADTIENEYETNGPELHQAGDTILHLRNSTTRHVDAVMKRVLEFFIGLVGKLEPQSINTNIKSHSDSGIVRDYKKWVGDFYTQAKFGVVSCFKHVVFTSLYAGVHS